MTAANEKPITCPVCWSSKLRLIPHSDKGLTHWCWDCEATWDESCRRAQPAELSTDDYMRLVEWMRSKPRRRANTAFTAGMLRSIAYAVEHAEQPAEGMDKHESPISADATKSKFIWMYISATAAGIESMRCDARAKGFQDVVDFAFDLDGVRCEISYEQLRAKLGVAVDQKAIAESAWEAGYISAQQDERYPPAPPLPDHVFEMIMANARSEAVNEADPYASKDHEVATAAVFAEQTAMFNAQWAKDFAGHMYGPDETERALLWYTKGWMAGARARGGQAD